MFLSPSASMPKVEDFYLGQEMPLQMKGVLVTPSILAVRADLLVCLWVSLISRLKWDGLLFQFIFSCPKTQTVANQYARDCIPLSLPDCSTLFPCSHYSLPTLNHHTDSISPSTQVLRPCEDEMHLLFWASCFSLFQWEQLCTLTPFQFPTSNLTQRQ